MQPWISQHFWVVFPVFFVVLWCAVMAIVSYVGGWTILARQYRYSSEFVGERWRMQSAQMRWWMNYNNCLTLGSNETGLYLSIMPLFRFCHPPLLIPWAEISVSRQCRFFLDYVRLCLGREVGIPLYFLHLLLSDGELFGRMSLKRWRTDVVAFRIYQYFS
jgi:hypothetical protein